MRFRMGLALGFGAGYVLGAKAVRERYEQIRSMTARAWESDQGRKMRESAVHAVEQVQEQAQGKLRSLRGGDGTIDLTHEQRERIGAPADYRA